MNEPPVVQQMILCDEVREHADKPRKHDLIGLIYKYRSPKKERPIRLPRLTVYLRLSNGRGEGDGQIVFIEYDTGRAIGASRPHHYKFGVNPLRSYGTTFTILDCKFPRPGYYLIEFRYNGAILAEQPLRVED